MPMFTERQAETDRVFSRTLVICVGMICFTVFATVATLQPNRYKLRQIEKRVEKIERYFPKTAPVDLL